MNALTENSRPTEAAPPLALDAGFGPNDLHRGSPLCVRQTYEMFCRELDRKQGMIDDLHQIANDNFGMTPEDCDLLTQTVADRDNLRAALTAMRALYA